MENGTISQAEAAAIATRVDRAREVRRWWTTGTNRPKAVVGLALSGGGVRSATFSLGLIQALARSKRDTLARVDVLSTVSGGGYVGTFLRSLFLPQEARGIGAYLHLNPSTQGYDLDPDAVLVQARFAAAVLKSGPDRKNIDYGHRNPIWWLREHSRYLAPNGPADYGYAVAYLTRNWAAMLFIFTLAVASVMAFVVGAEALIAPLVPGIWRKAAELIVPVSPVLLLAAVPLVGSAVLSIAYWLSQGMFPNERQVRRQRLNLAKGVLLALLGGALITACWGALAWWRAPPWWPMPLALAAGLSLALAAITAVVLGALPNWETTLLTAELRRRLTTLLASCNLILLAVLVVAVVDSAGAGFAYWLGDPDGHSGRFAIMALGPVAAFLFKKLSDLGDRAGTGGGFPRLARLLPALALLAGVVLYGAVAVAADALLHGVAWSGAAWQTPVQGPMLALVIAAVWILAIIVGQATGLINLSSLHLLYAVRLTRAYPGASNVARLHKAADPEPGGEITDNDDADYIRPCNYGLADLPAPIHIINTTINETIDPHSQLVARDRKGGLLSVEPAGIRTDRHDEEMDQTGAVGRGDRVMATTTLTPWSEIGRREVAEDISLGQWCAISGAAASSGMGRLMVRLHGLHAVRGPRR